MLPAMLLWPLVTAAVNPRLNTSTGTIVGTTVAPGVERFGNIPYALPPLGARRFARSVLNTEQWPGGVLDGTRPGPACIQNPLGDPRPPNSESDAPTEDCLQLNIWRPADASPEEKLPVLVYLFGGGLCTGFAGNPYFNASVMVQRHRIIFVTVSYRLGALGYIYGSDPSRPGTGGMNGIWDSAVALQWLQTRVHEFGGDPKQVTLSGQSSGAYALCTLCVAPEAKGLFHRAILNSGPCVGGWGPLNRAKGEEVTKKILATNGVSDLEGLRKVPAEQVQWPDEYMNNLTEAPYFSAYFDDAGVVPGSTDELWAKGEINPSDVYIAFMSKDGTAAFYGTAPTLGLIAPDTNENNPEGYRKAMEFVWGAEAEKVMEVYPLSSHPTASAAFVQADGESYVSCPLRRMARAVAGSRRVWVEEFAHFQPSSKPPQGCEGDCEGWGCDNGVELDVVPGTPDNTTRLWATHGSSYRFAFGTEIGPDGLGPPNNVTYCTFSPEERILSEQLMAYWASFVRTGDPNSAKHSTAPIWPQYRPSAVSRGHRLRLSALKVDGVAPQIIEGFNDDRCDFWDNFTASSR
eukprot:Hpha_TRINITY_DN26478_c0_g1::TRINITY_DN26478_c0_g1_i1::g.34086::m.34086